VRSMYVLFSSSPGGFSNSQANQLVTLGFESSRSEAGRVYVFISNWNGPDLILINLI